MSLAAPPLSAMTTTGRCSLSAAATPSSAPTPPATTSCTATTGFLFLSAVVTLSAAEVDETESEGDVGRPALPPPRALLRPHARRECLREADVSSELPAHRSGPSRSSGSQIASTTADCIRMSTCPSAHSDATGCRDESAPPAAPGFFAPACRDGVARTLESRVAADAERIIG